MATYCGRDYPSRITNLFRVNSINIESSDVILDCITQGCHWQRKKDARNLIRAIIFKFGDRWFYLWSISRDGKQCMRFLSQEDNQPQSEVGIYHRFLTSQQIILELLVYICVVLGQCDDGGREHVWGLIFTIAQPVEDFIHVLRQHKYYFINLSKHTNRYFSRKQSEERWPEKHL